MDGEHEEENKVITSSIPNIIKPLNCAVITNMKLIKAMFFRLSHDVVTCDVDRDVSTAYC